jgi:hypothetical protein
VRAATRRSLEALGEVEEEAEVEVPRWEAPVRGRHMNLWLIGALGFIALAIGAVFVTPLSQFAF